MIKFINKFVFNSAVAKFFLSLIIASMLWLLTVLANKYNTIENFPVRFINLPQNKVLINKLPATIAVELNSAGFRLMLMRLNLLQDTLIIDASLANKLEVENKSELQLNNQIKQISEQLGNDFTVLKVTPEAINLNFDKKEFKLFYIKLNFDCSYEKQFQQSGKINIIPHKILVKGPKSILEKMDNSFFETEFLKLEKLNKTTISFVSLRLNEDYGNIEFSTKKVMVKIPVEKFTETKIDLPIQVINVPEGMQMKLFPDKTKLVCWVALSNFENLKPELFSVFANYNDIVNAQQTKIKLTLNKVPDFILYPELEVQKVEFIIRK